MADRFLKFFPHTCKLSPKERKDYSNPQTEQRKSTKPQQPHRAGGKNANPLHFQATLPIPQKYKDITFKTGLYSILFCIYSTSWLKETMPDR